MMVSAGVRRACEKVAAMEEHPDRAEHILEIALMLGEREGWDAVHLHDVAQEMGIALTDIHAYYQHKDDLAEAWFDRAELALIRAGEAAGWGCLSTRERLLRTMLAWFDALAIHRGLSIQMLRYKLQPDHLHLQAAALLRISRTVQWIRETARMPTVGRRREIEEVMLTGIFLSATACWLLDRSPDARRTRSWLEHRLASAERMALRFPDRLTPWTPSRMP